jgi:hypothetical protein
MTALRTKPDTVTAHTAADLIRMADLAGMASGIERDDEIDAFCQSLWDQDGDQSLMIEIGNELHDKPAPFSDDLSAAMALAVRVLDDGPIDIEVAHRTVGNTRYGRAEICGPKDDAAARARTPALAILAATFHALAARAEGRQP